MANTYTCLTKGIRTAALPADIESLMDTVDIQSNARIKAFSEIHKLETDICMYALCERSAWIMVQVGEISRAERLHGIAYLGKWSAILQEEQIAPAIRDLSILLQRLWDAPFPILHPAERDAPYVTREMIDNETRDVRHTLTEPIELPGGIRGSDDQHPRYLIRFLAAQKAVLEQASARDLCVIYAWL
jgi:hypothetical protein